MHVHKEGVSLFFGETAGHILKHLLNHPNPELWGGKSKATVCFRYRQANIKCKSEVIESALESGLRSDKLCDLGQAV